MEKALRQLMDALPPPESVGGRNEDWPKMEAEINLAFPSHFKNLLGVYGDSVWFDLYYILYPVASETTENYLQAVREQLKILEVHGITNEKGNDISMPLYPEEGGLFPFMVSSDGDYYFWQTNKDNPDDWPMVVWQMDTLSTLAFRTLAELFLNTLAWMQKHQPHRVWVRPRIEG